MRHMCLRVFTVMALLLAINFMLLPAAEAKSLSASRPAAHDTTGWFDAILAWMGNLLNGGQTGHSSGLKHQSSASTSTITSGFKYTTDTGPCIDPLGLNGCNPSQ